MIFDIESDALELKEVTKIHVMAYTEGGVVKYTHSYNEMRELFLNAKVLIGHNIICYDIPVVEKILGIKVKAKLVDTLPLAWYMFPNRQRYGLEFFGEDYGIEKPPIQDWVNLSPEEYAHRCVEDVKINTKLYNNLMQKLKVIYNDNTKSINRIISYLSFKMSCVHLQETSKWKVDVPLVESSLEELEKEFEEKISALTKELPGVEVYADKIRPAKPFKKDGTWSVTGAKWFNLLKEHNLPEDYNGSVKVLVDVKEPNPNSTDQIKSWLTSLGWKPTSFKYVKDDFGNERSIPQVRVDGEDGKELCQSVLKLSKKHPPILLLEGITVLEHRIGILKGFLKNMDEDGYLKASVGGLTNTLRFKHRVLVNLPGINKPYGKIIRGALIAPKGYELCGSDMSSLESNTKKHFMYPHDPDYVNEMSKPGFDEHLDLAKVAGKVTQEQIDQYNAGQLPKIKSIRTRFKPVNYAGVYGVGAPTLSRSSGLPISECRDLLKLYWERNWAVKKVAEETVTKTVDGEMWLYNPVSEFWYSLRYEKDIFSTLNQGTGVYCFDCWVKEVVKQREQLTGQFHDEIILTLKKGNREKCEALLRSAIDTVNNKLKLNVKLDIDVQFGDRYSEIH